ncbi:MAG: hypothetical protein RR382_00470 [Tannerellaceae bacterium]
MNALTETLRVTVDNGTLRILITTESESRAKKAITWFTKTKVMTVTDERDGTDSIQVTATIPVSELSTSTRCIVDNTIIKYKRLVGVDIAQGSAYIMREYLVSRSMNLVKWYDRCMLTSYWNVANQPPYVNVLHRLVYLDRILSYYSREANRLTRIIPATVVVECVCTFLSARYIFAEHLTDNTSYPASALVLSVPFSIFLIVDALISRYKLSKRAKCGRGIPELITLERNEAIHSYDGFSDYINETLEHVRQANDALCDLCCTYRKCTWSSLKVLYFVLFLLYWMVAVVSLHGNQ